MDQLDELRCFLAVAEAGGFSAAARQTGLRQPSVSKAVAALEHRLGLTLFHRSTRQVSLTESGRLYYDRCRPLLEELEEAAVEAAAGAASASGVLRVSAPATFGRLHLVPILPAFLERHPGLKIDLVLSDTQTDLIREGIDVALRVGRVDDLSAVVRRIARTRLVVVGSNTYFARHGVPLRPEDLRRHNCLVYGRHAGADEWAFNGPEGVQRVSVTGNLRSDSIDAIRAAVAASLGIGAMTQASFISELADGSIREVLGDHGRATMDINAVWTSRRFVPSKVRLFVDHVSRQLPAML